jgi:hypothetical protein
MRYVALLCTVLLSGCLEDDLYYVDGSVWEPIEDRDVTQLLKNDALVKHPYLRRMPTTEQEWTRFVQTLNAQPIRNLGDVEQTFTPTSWTGFSSDPVGTISYYSFGDLVVLSRAVSDLTGTSDAADMTFSGLPEDIRPKTSSVVRSVPCITLLNGVQVASIAHIDWTGTVTFGAGDTTATAGRLRYTESYNTVGSKGLPAGWHVIFTR